MNTITTTNRRLTGGTSPGSGDRRAALTETIPIVQLLSPDVTEAALLNGGAGIPGVDSTAEAEEAPGGESDGGSEQASSGAPSSLMDWYARFRERIPARRYDWPDEAERQGERLKCNQAIAVELLVSGMTQTDVAKRLGVNRSTVYRWHNDPIFVAQLEARRGELISSLLDLQLLGSRIGMGKLLELVESPNDSLALRAATTLVSSGHRAYQSIDEKKGRERLEDHLGILGGFKV